MRFLVAAGLCFKACRVFGNERFFQAFASRAHAASVQHVFGGARLFEGFSHRIYQAKFEASRAGQVVSAQRGDVRLQRVSFVAVVGQIRLGSFSEVSNSTGVITAIVSHT